MATPARVVAPLVAYLEKHDLPSLSAVLADAARTFLMPIGVTMLVIGGVASIAARIYRVFRPHPVGHRYVEARLLYRKGQTKKALAEWRRMEDYGPACLSRACHALYVEWDAAAALGILRTAQQRRVRLRAAARETMRLDALALRGPGGASNRTMMDLNARLAKQEHLGINSE